MITLPQYVTLLHCLELLIDAFEQDGDAIKRMLTDDCKQSSNFYDNLYGLKLNIQDITVSACGNAEDT